MNRILSMVALFPEYRPRISVEFPAEVPPDFPTYWLYAQTSPAPRGLGRRRQALWTAFPLLQGVAGGRGEAEIDPPSDPIPRIAFPKRQACQPRVLSRRCRKVASEGTWPRCKTARKKGSARKVPMAAFTISKITAMSSEIN